MIHHMVSVWFFVFQDMQEPPKVQEGLQSTTEIVVPPTTIDDKSHCTTMYMYPRCGFRPFHQADRFISETIYLF